MTEFDALVSEMRYSNAFLTHRDYVDLLASFALQDNGDLVRMAERHLNRSAGQHMRHQATRVRESCELHGIPVPAWARA